MLKKTATIIAIVLAALMAVGIGSAATNPSSDSTTTTTSSTSRRVIRAVRARARGHP